MCEPCVERNLPGGCGAVDGGCARRDTSARRAAPRRCVPATARTTATRALAATLAASRSSKASGRRRQLGREPCPESGSCPGAADGVARPPGSKPIVMPVGRSRRRRRAELAQTLTLEADVTEVEETSSSTRWRLPTSWRPRRVRRSPRAGRDRCRNRQRRLDPNPAAVRRCGRGGRQRRQPRLWCDDVQRERAGGATQRDRDQLDGAAAETRGGVETKCPPGKWCSASKNISCPVNVPSVKTPTTRRRACRAAQLGDGGRQRLLLLRLRVQSRFSQTRGAIPG